MKLTHLSSALVTLGLLAAPGVAWSQSQTDLDDFGGLSTRPSATLADEKAALLQDKGVQSAEEEERRRRRVIKTLQKKTFMKLGRTELGLGLGMVSNDPFINRYIIRGDLGFHFTEIASIQIEAGLSPDFGESDWKAITKQIVNNNNVTPDISKIQFYGNATLQFAPIYGKVAAPGNKIINFDIFGLFGTGVVNTADDLDVLGATDNPAAIDTEIQWHPTLNYGGGVRVMFTNNLAMRVEGRGLSYIEAIEGVNLEMKNNLVVQASVSYLLGKGK